MQFSEFDDRELWYKATYFQHSLAGNQKFWNRLGGRPDITGAKALDLGCGLGMLSVDLAEAGCRRVVGLDPNERALAWASDYVATEYPQFVDAISFTPGVIEQLNESGFDLIASNQTFEHVMNLDVVLPAIRNHLRPGGRAFIGFGPLYQSPFGHHGWTGTKLPWGHLFLSESKLVERINQRREEPIVSVRDLGLNMLSLLEYRRLIDASGLRVIAFRTNQNEHAAARLFRLAAHVPLVTRYVTNNVYVILQRDG